MHVQEAGAENTSSQSGLSTWHSGSCKLVTQALVLDYINMLIVPPAGYPPYEWPSPATGARLMQRDLWRRARGHTGSVPSVKLGAESWKIDHAQAVAIVTHHSV